jgi:hypothetical protein
MESPPILITYDNAPTETSHFFFETCARNDWNVKHLGLGEKWEGFINKIKAYAKICSELPAKQIVVISDARDVFCVRPPKAFIEAFLEFKGDIVISTELLCEGNFEASESDIHIQCFPLNKYYSARDIKPGIRKYINSGLIAGRAGAIADMWTWILENKYTDDQLGVCKYAVTFPARIELDIHASLLHSSTFGVNAGIQSIHIQKQDSPTFAEFMGCGAFFLHIPGNKNKGQSIIYDMVKMVLEKYSSNHLLALYNYPIPECNEVF